MSDRTVGEPVEYCGATKDPLPIDPVTDLMNKCGILERKAAKLQVEIRRRQHELRITGRTLYLTKCKLGELVDRR